MKKVLLHMPLKTGTLDRYLDFLRETQQRADEYRDMLKRYDIWHATVWHTEIDGKHCAFVYHEVGPAFDDNMKGWDTSTHPFDTWFRENLMAVYDIESVGTAATMQQALDFKV